MLFALGSGALGIFFAIGLGLAALLLLALCLSILIPALLGAAPASADEVQATYEQLLKHGVRIIQRARVISKYSTEQVLGQLRLELEGHGDAETRGHGDAGTRRRGDTETRG